VEIGLYGSALTAWQDPERTIAVSVLAPEAESRGFDAVFIGEHSHCPVDATLPKWMGAVGGKPFPEWYRHYPDPFVVLAHAGALTTRLKLGIAVSLVAIHDPILLAKTVATLDCVTGGRVIFGVGYGYNEPEFRNHGVDRDLRREIVREKILAMQRLWSQETAGFEGNHVSFSKSWQHPKPFQQPRPPVLIGGQLIPKTLDHLVEWGDGWVVTNMMAKGKLGAEIVKLRERFEAAGRNPDDLDITIFHSVDHFKERVWDYRSGAAPVTQEVLAQYESKGVTRLCLPVPNESATTVLPLLDQYVDAVGDHLHSATSKPQSCLIEG
jgi:probable F420-dependent oxidoreductase